MISLIEKFIGGCAKNNSNRNIDNPIFIFSASWRTGSTLLQRIINASGEIFIWGEPAFFPETLKLYSRVQHYLEKGDWKKVGKSVAKTGRWIPVVSPQKHRLKITFRSFFNALYMDDTLALGYERWGTKEVRANALEHMQLLLEIFPKSKFIFLTRNPYDVYQSLKGKKFHNNFDNPFVPIQVWNDNVCQILNEKRDITNKCLVVKYEDLISNTKINHKDLTDIASHINISITDDMFDEINTVIDSSKNNSNKLVQPEIQAINNIIKDTIDISGYDFQH